MKTQVMTNEGIRDEVREHYGKVVETRSGCGCSTTCCGSGTTEDRMRWDPAASAAQMGYSPEEIQTAPPDSNLGLGCGNPQALAKLKPGDSVLDLGSGAGFDAFLAGRMVGPEGRVIGVDMTPGMIAQARKNQSKSLQPHVEFRLGEIEALPVGDETMDVIISNCVINLSPEKERVFREAFRVLKPGGRLALADIVAIAPIPQELRAQFELYTGCVAGAVSADDLKRMMAEAGIEQIAVEPKVQSRNMVQGWFPGLNVEDYVVSATVEAIKPR